LGLEAIGADGYGFQIGLSYRTVLAGATIQEVPIQFGERTSGTSKMSLKIMVEAFWLVAVTAAQRLVHRQPSLR
jgi:dolichol-phosphate mannosyltransferase